MGHFPARQPASMANGECSGNHSDLRLERRWKRRCVANQSFNPNSHSNVPMVIENYKRRERLELLNSGKFSSVRCRDIDFNNNNNDDDDDVDGLTNAMNGVGVDNHVKDKDEDPQYRMFLKNLKKKGNSYALEVFLDNGVCELINYEGYRFVEHGCKGGTHLVEHEYNHGEDKSDDVDEGYYKLLNPSIGGTIGSSITPGSGDHEDEYADVEYCRFLNLACSGTTRHSNEKTGLEGDHLVESECEEEDKVRFQQYLTFLDSYVVNDEDTVHRSDDGPERPDEVKESEHRIDDGPERPDEVNESEHRIDDGADRLDEVKESELGRECDQDDDDVAEDYLRFLDLLEKDGEDKMYKIVDDPERFDQDEDSEFDLEIAATEKDPCNGGYFNPIDLDKWSLAQDPGASQSQFKKGLIEILKKPYDPQEHRDLWDEAFRRRPKEKERNLRRQTKSCPLENSFCKSYIDQYSDLAEQIDLAKYDDHRTLNLLRGFFYWLKNLAHVGVFPPWKDPSCLEVLPQN